MTLAIVLVVWFALGYVAGRAGTVAFESNYGSGTSGIIGGMCFAMGPIGLFVALIGSTVTADFKEVWAATLGLAPMVLHNEPYGYFPIDKPRGAVDKFFLLGVKNKPDYDKNTEDYARAYPSLDIRARR